MSNQTFQIIILIISFLTLLGGIITVYIKTVIEIAKIQVQMKNFEKDLMTKEIAICKLEDRNTIEHDKIITKIDLLINQN
jgi:uncharacterized protein (DUF697 family)